MQGKVIGFEEHYKLPAIHEANRDNPGELVFDVWKRAGRFETDAQGGWPAGIYDLGEGRIAAMDAAGIDVQILSHTSPGPETLEPSLAVDLATRRTTTSRLRSRSIPNGSWASPPCRCSTRRLPRASSSALSATRVS
jgi:predicted TIM-barrel fold metal-dependent hydrolase